MRSAIDTFLALVSQRNPRFEPDLSKLLRFEALIQKLDSGDQTALAIFNTEKQRCNQTDEGMKAYWLQLAADERRQQRRQIPLRHEFGSPPKPSFLDAFEFELQGASDSLYELYARHDGAQVFVDPDNSDSSGFMFISLSEMEKERTMIREWFESFDDDDSEHEQDKNGMQTYYFLPDWFDSSICFGAFSNSADRCILAVEGPLRGSVFIFDHPSTLSQRTKSFDEFLRLLVAEPASYAGSYFDGFTFRADP